MLSSITKSLAVIAIAALLFLGSTGDDQRWLACLFGAAPFILYLIWAAVPLPAQAENRAVQRLGGVLLTFFVLISLQLLREQVLTATATKDRTQVINADKGVVISDPRRADAELRTERGRIYDAAGQPVADRVIVSGGYVKRTYPNPYTAYLAGYYSPLRFGNFGLEDMYNKWLTGQEGNNPLADQVNALLHRPAVGNDLHLTINPDLQQVATNALLNCSNQSNGCIGAAVVLDVHTGAVLAMASNPRFDPSQIAADPAADPDAERDRISAYWNSLQSDAAHPLVIRATAGLYPPGSTFKTVTLVAGLDTGKYTLQTPFHDPGYVDINHHREVDCATCRPPASVHPADIFTMIEGYQWSLNVVFASAAALPPNALGASTMAEYIRRFGVGNRHLMDDFPLSTSRVCAGTNDPADMQCLFSPDNGPNLVAETAFGQGQLQVTPMQMAVIAATVARGGEVPQPYVVNGITQPAPGGDKILFRAQPKSLGRIMTPETATTARNAMYTSVQKGWANGAAITGYAVGGKTGTAETGRNGIFHSWFIAIAGKDPNNPDYAICVMFENGGEGTRVALPAAKKIMVWLSQNSVK
ncbi:MAG: hypothetical protein DLM69_08970 [Candidatus Chloroheliales bacterium]|nr:MAG: hypothetical protein DLM69_08970 [Chloroflexota bacterium]